MMIELVCYQRSKLATSLNVGKLTALGPFERSSGHSLDVKGFVCKRSMVIIKGEQSFLQL